MFDMQSNHIPLEATSRRTGTERVCATDRQEHTPDRRGLALRPDRGGFRAVIGRILGRRKPGWDWLF